MKREPDVYGRVLVGEPGAVKALGADHVIGVRVARNSEGRPAAVGIQWMGDDGDLTGLTVDLPNAMWLLSCLKSMQLDLELPFPDDPRDPTWKASDYKKKLGIGASARLKVF